MRRLPEARTHPRARPVRPGRRRRAAHRERSAGRRPVRPGFGLRVAHVGTERGRPDVPAIPGAGRVGGRACDHVGARLGVSPAAQAGKQLSRGAAAFRARLPGAAGAVRRRPARHSRHLGHDGLHDVRHHSFLHHCRSVQGGAHRFGALSMRQAKWCRCSAFSWARGWEPPARCTCPAPTPRSRSSGMGCLYLLTIGASWLVGRDRVPRLRTTPTGSLCRRAPAPTARGRRPDGRGHKRHGRAGTRRAARPGGPGVPAERAGNEDIQAAGGRAHHRAHRAGPVFVAKRREVPRSEDLSRLRRACAPS